uniref:Predicted protein n=1 Tax=Hordeum vulgare subsp. vulgare TaxID=112509 RepID=F2DTA7_HORVV|nr:predicted protein [Hordeum vulgare subsp. vulgare]
MNCSVLSTICAHLHSTTSTTPSAPTFSRKSMIMERLIWILMRFSRSYLFWAQEYLSRCCLRFIRIACLPFFSFTLSRKAAKSMQQG